MKREELSLQLGINKKQQKNKLQRNSHRQFKKNSLLIINHRVVAEGSKSESQKIQSQEKDKMKKRRIESGL